MERVVSDRRIRAWVKPRRRVLVGASMKGMLRASPRSGPVDATFKAIEADIPFANHSWHLLVNGHHAGDRFPGEARLRLEKGRPQVQWQCADTDIVVASPKAI